MTPSTSSQPAASSPSLPSLVRRSDYHEPDWIADSVVLHFTLDAQDTIVTTACRYRRRPGSGNHAPLKLDGESLDTLAVAVDDRHLSVETLAFEQGQLVLRELPDEFTLHTQVRIHPSLNLELSGLYATGSTLLTQCEAQGFRRITWFQDRPDVMTTFRVILAAQRTQYPVLLSNGNLLDDDAPAAAAARAALSVLPLPAAVDGDWHEAVWEDPFPKPSYLFALVAGNLAVNETRYRLASGREVLLQVWTEPEHIQRTDFALKSLEKAIAWDERRFGLELDLDRFMIVAAPDFNMGAMENKGLNIFNAKFVFADPFVATDMDFEWIESIIGHEYFHNWTGNRITCRDWFQLTLKEGLTVFRDQEFTADLMSSGVPAQAASSVRALKRMDNVRMLRQKQFAEDAGPMRHPIRPDSYQAIDNFYTATVYEKGAEVVRMLQTLLGVAGFRRGMDLYFDRHDGQAVTCEAFVSAMADANDRDLSQFMRWYSTPGTPQLQVRSQYDAEQQRLVLSLTQLLPDATGKPVPAGDRALHIPVEVALLDRDSGKMQQGRLLELKTERQDFIFEGVTSTEPRGPMLSLLRDFSAPVIVDYPYTDDDLASLLRHDDNLFNRWDAGQQLAERALLQAVRTGDGGEALQALSTALAATLPDPRLDDGLRQQILTLPDENLLAEQLSSLDPALLRSRRLAGLQEIVRPLIPWLTEVVSRRHWQADYSLDVSVIGERALANTALLLLVLSHADNAATFAREQFEGANNLTDRLGALKALVHASVDDAQWALDHFEQIYRHETHVMDKWFAVQALMPGTHEPTLARVRRLMDHPAWNNQNPNKVRSLLHTFFADNLAEFHRTDGEGYALWRDEVLRLDRSNPQVAARMARTLDRHHRFVPVLAQQMQAVLEQVAQEAQSPDVREVIAKELGAL
ncbi:MAG: aminopeptidase N [Lautropia sp.]|nr:aminopeptidase N [Lautropia sp.]